ncbi:MAG: Hsp20 family protein [Gammaproteobacteria bacterium]|nr:Hsp20 family protein [Gammaproteobacteria bacterium]
MNTIDLTPLYRSSIGFDRFGSMLDTALRSDKSAAGYPPYDIESLGENEYAITLAVAGFGDSEIDIQVEKGVLSVRGKKVEPENARSYLYQGIANRSFERKFNLADFIEVTGADLNNGLLTINLMKEIPEAMKPKKIAIGKSGKTLEHKAKDKAA